MVRVPVSPAAWFTAGLWTGAVVTAMLFVLRGLVTSRLPFAGGS